MEPTAFSESASEALKWPRLLRLDRNFFAAAFSIMKLFPASFIIREAEARGQLKQSTVIVETTSGTFGLALAMVCAERGYKLVLVGDEAIDATLRDRIESLGAELLIVKKSAETGGIQQARLSLLAELRRKYEDHFWPAQYENPDNAASYAEFAEVLRKALGQIDCLVGTVGTGGSMCGTASALRSLCPELHVVGVDTHGSVLFGQPDRPKRLLRGLGNSLMPGNVVHSIFDEIHWVNAGDAFEAARELNRKHAIFMGPTSGAAWLVGSWWAKQNPGMSVVAILPDDGHRYQSTVYDTNWITRQGLERAGLPTQPITVRDPKFLDDVWARLFWNRRRFDEVVMTPVVREVPL